jgi:glycosyltransferase involved in cell wall biosynthesis
MRFLPLTATADPLAEIRRRTGPSWTAGPIDADALSDFTARYGAPALGPVVVVIPAYNEEGSIGSVVDRIPPTVGGQTTSTVVVVDGATDATAKVSEDHGAYTCRARAKRGQGAALRLGYKVAVDHGARYIVVVDADGQYDPGQMDTVAAPIMEGWADLVLGSRRLGHAHVDDRVRYAGVVLFSALISVLTGVRVTDSSSGFKALSAEVASGVRLEEPQYQAAELLLETIGRKFRVAEVPVTMRPRSSGRTKKGPNLLYGAHYARVILSTWWKWR